MYLPSSTSLIAGSVVRDELKKLIAAWQEAWFAKDAAAIAQMMAKDYVYVAPNGAILDRAAILQIVGDPTYGLTSGTHAETTVVMLGEDAALVRHRWQAPGHFVARCSWMTIGARRSATVQAAGGAFGTPLNTEHG